MRTKAIGVTEAEYDRLAAEKRADERFTDTIARLVGTATADWRRGFGRYGDEGGDEFERTSPNREPSVQRASLTAATKRSASWASNSTRTGTWFPAPTTPIRPLTRRC